MSISITEEAKSKILEAIGARPEAGQPMLRVEARANGAPDFAYGLKLISADEVRDDDVTLESAGIEIVMDPSSAKNLEGATIDFEDRIVRSGFKFLNPNRPESPQIGSGPRPDLSGPVAERIQRLLDTEINPAVAAHGGVIQFHGVREGKAYLSFGGGCHGCGMVDVTLKQGVEARIREVIPEIDEVIDTTDHSTGENPYYQ